MLLGNKDDRSGVRLQVWIVAPPAELTAQIAHRAALATRGLELLETFEHHQFEIRDAAARIEREKGLRGRERHQLDSRQRMESLTVDNDEKVSVADLDKLYVSGGRSG